MVTLAGYGWAHLLLGLVFAPFLRLSGDYFLFSVLFSELIVRDELNHQPGHRGLSDCDSLAIQPMVMAVESYIRFQGSLHPAEGCFKGTTRFQFVASRSCVLDTRRVRLDSIFASWGRLSLDAELH